MSNAITLASKYRPHTFEDIVEQDSIKTILKNQIKSDDLKHAYLFCGSAGTGKAQPLDSLVLTPNGYVKMGDVYIGQEVIDGEGNLTIITDIFPQGIKPIYRVTFSDRTSVLCSDEHLWKVGEYNDHKKIVSWSVKNVNDLLAIGIRKKHSKTETRLRYRIPLPVIQFADNILDVDPYLMGVLLGDGALTDKTINIANPERDIIEKVKKCLNGTDFEIRMINQKDLDRCPIYNIVQKEVKVTNQFMKKTSFRSVYLDKYGVCKKSVDKHIPKEYLYTTVENRIKLLQGLFDTDGWVDNRNVRSVLQFSTSSKQLSDDFAFLVRSLGGTDTVVLKQKGYKLKNENEYRGVSDTYEHTIKLPDSILPFSSKKHMDKYKKPQNGPQRKIVNIEYVGKQECQCIKVQSDDHTYITDNLTVTHNTTSARIIADLMNEGKSTPIELDCASHNGVDDVRAIIDECKTKPMMGKYKIFILDECHQFSTSAWNALLKILEEPPEYVIFLFCTTDPQKILGTILSRVQRFNFSRISIAGITARLKYIIENENNEREVAGVDPIVYEDNAIDYIARLSQGGMRDSITTLEKCLDYSTTINLMNVINVTSGGVTEDVLLEMLSHILNNKCSEALLLFEKIYMSGVDVSLFLKLWTEYLQNCTKYVITQTAEITILSDITINRLDMALRPESGINIIASVKQLLDSVFHIKSNYSTDDMRILIESWIIEVCNS